MKEESIRPQVKVPEAEANELTRRLRHTKELQGVGLSVYAYISKEGHRALHVAVDKKLGSGNYLSYDLRYKADTDIEKLERNAVKRIRAQFDI